MIIKEGFIKTFEEGETVKHRWNHWELGVIIGTDKERDQYLVQWIGGPTLDHPSFILESVKENNE